MSRLNPNGSPDNSFGNVNFDGNVPNTRGRLNISVNTFNTANVQPGIAQILLRPNGKFNLIGTATANEGGNSPRSFVSQNINVSRSGVFSDFTNDGKTDIGVFRSGTWYYLNSANSQFNGVSFGQAGDTPAPADYDGDSKSDIAVFRPSNGYWYRLNSSTGAFVANQFGQNGDKPVAADYDNDGKIDLTIFRAGTWYGLRSSDNSVFGVAFGAATDTPIPAAYLP